jgi:hypothetical protein
MGNRFYDFPYGQKIYNPNLIDLSKLVIQGNDKDVDLLGSTVADSAYFNKIASPGLVVIDPVPSSDLIVNGGFADSTSWDVNTNGTGWEIAGGVAHYDNSPYSTLEQSFGFLFAVSARYRFVFTISNASTPVLLTITSDYFDSLAFTHTNTWPNGTHTVEFSVPTGGDVILAASPQAAFDLDNVSLVAIDPKHHDVVWYDSTQTKWVNVPIDSLTKGTIIADSIYARAYGPSGTDTFTTTATSDTVSVLGTTTNSIFIVSSRAGAPNTLPVAGDQLNWYPITDKLIVNRAIGSTSGLGYSWFRVRK